MPRSGTVALLILLLSTARASGAAKDPDPAADFFGPDKIHALHLRIDADNWTLMQPARRARPLPLVADQIPAPPASPESPRGRPSVPLQERPDPPATNGDKLPPNNFGYEYVYVKADLTVNDQPFSDVAARFKGNASYNNAQNSPRRPYKIDFDRFVPRRKFRGTHASLNLSNNAYDPSHLREALSYEVYRRAGVPAPRTALAVLHLTVPGQYDRVYLGVYTVVEEVDDKPFLKTHFDATDGLLLKPEGVRGLPYLGENWAAYPHRYNPKTGDPDPETSRAFIDFVKLVNYADDATFRREIAARCDVDQVLRYLAATVLIANLDSPLVTNHNYYLHTRPRTGRTQILPWDMNLSFAGYGNSGPRDDQVHLSITHPWAGSNKLFERILGIPEYERAYRAHLRTFVQQFFSEPQMLALINTMKVALKEADKAALAAKQSAPSIEPANSSAFGATRHTLKTFVSQRVPAVLDQLDDADVPTFIPRATSPRVAFPWGLRAGREFGSLPTIAQEVRKLADADGDYHLSLDEGHAAAQTLFAHLAAPPTPAPNGDANLTPSSQPKATTRMTSPDSTPNVDDRPESLDRPTLAVALTPLLTRDLAPNAASSRGGGGLLGLFRPRAPSDSAVAWSTTLLRTADTDGDLLVSPAELTGLVARTFCLADRNHDDRLDERELTEALDLLATTPADDLLAPRPPAR